jgi:putative membrane protein
MNKKYLLLLALPFFFTIQACNQQKSAKDDKIYSTGITFIKTVNEASHAEIKAATIAQTTSKNPRVTNFAQKVIADLTNSLQKLQDLKTDAGITTTDEISAGHKKTIYSISKLSGTQFDQAYMKTAVSNSGKIVILFVDASQSKSSAIDTFARRGIPVMQSHLDSARKIAASLK